MNNENNLFSEYRKDKKLRQKDVAEYLHVAVATYANWEQGRTEPDLESLKKLSSLYDATINQLLGLTDKDLILISRNQYERIYKAKELLEIVIEEMEINGAGNLTPNKKKRIKYKK